MKAVPPGDGAVKHRQGWRLNRTGGWTAPAALKPQAAVGLQPLQMYIGTFPGAECGYCGANRSAWDAKAHHEPGRKAQLLAGLGPHRPKAPMVSLLQRCSLTPVM